MKVRDPVFVRRLRTACGVTLAPALVAVVLAGSVASGGPARLCGATVARGEAQVRPSGGEWLGQ